GVDDAIVAELLMQPLRHAEHAADAPDVLAEHHDAVVAPHLYAERVAYRLDHVQLRHESLSAPGRGARRAALSAGRVGSKWAPQIRLRTATPNVACPASLRTRRLRGSAARCRGSAPLARFGSTPVGARGTGARARWG